MKKVHLFSESICKHYVAPRWSAAYIFSTVCTMLTFAIPFFLCFSPRYALKNNNSLSQSNQNSFSNRIRSTKNTIATPVGIWLKHDIYREQPKVQFRYKVIFVAQGKEKMFDESKQSVNSSNGGGEHYMIPKELYYSTIDSINELRPETFRSASATSREADNDSDGVTDHLRLTIKMPLKENEYVYGMQAIVFVQYRLEAHVKMEMESLAYVHHESGLAGSKFSSTGDLCLRQMVPIPIMDDSSNDGELWTLFEDDKLLDIHSVERGVAMESNVRNIIQKYQSRNIATDYIQRFPVWTRQHDEYYHSVQNGDNDAGENEKKEYTKDFEFDLTVVIPKMQSIIYVPTLMEVLAEAWVRYLSFLVITGFCLRHLFLFVFTNHIVNSNMSIG